MSYFDSGLDLVEILGDFIGDDESAGDDTFAGDDILAGLDEIGADELVGALMAAKKRQPLRRPMPARRPMPIRRPMASGAGLAKLQAAALQKRAMTEAIAERRVMAGALLKERQPTRAREYPLGFVSNGAVGAGASARITTRPQVPFRLDRLVVPSDLAGLFTIDDVKVGKNSQFAAEGSVPARIFQENGVGVCLKGDTAQISMDVTISVTNISGAASFFRAAVIGPAVE